MSYNLFSNKIKEPLDIVDEIKKKCRGDGV